MTANCLLHPDQRIPCAICGHQLSQTPQVITDHELALSIRAGLLGIARCLEVGGDRRTVDMAIRAELLGMATAIEKRWKIKPKKPN